MANIFSEIFNKPFDSGAGAPPTINVGEFKNLIESRRSVRKFTNKDVPEETMLEILRAGTLAPSSSNLQPWEFYWIRSDQIRKKINLAFLSQPAVTTAKEIVIVVARTNTWRRNAAEMVKLIKSKTKSPPKSLLTYYERLVPLSLSVGPLGLFGVLKAMMVFVIGLFRAIPREHTSACSVKIWAVKSAALACENIMLAARAHGFDSCPMEGMDSRRVEKILNLPKDAVIVMGISIGERASNGVYGPQLRLDPDWFIKKV